MVDIKWVRILIGEYAGKEAILGGYDITPRGDMVRLSLMIDGIYQYPIFKLGQGKSLRERLKGAVEEISPILSSEDIKKIAEADFFLALVEDDFFTNELALAQLECAINHKKPIHILKLRSVDLQMEYFTDADVKSMHDFANTGELVQAVGNMFGTMDAATEVKGIQLKTGDFPCICNEAVAMKGVTRCLNCGGRLRPEVFDIDNRGDSE